MSDPKIHPLGGGATRCTTLPDTAKERKTYPIATGFLDYFPDAIAEIAKLSYIANEQHNSGKPIHWARGKSGDEADTLMRHFLQRGTRDTDGQRHSTKVAWRALAALQKEIEEDSARLQLPGILGTWGASRHLPGLVRDLYAPHTGSAGLPSADIVVGK